MFNFTLTTPVSILISLAALAGVSLHDTKLDKLATAFAGIPAMMTTSESNNKGFGEQHTHVERVSLNDLSSSQPRLSPRNDYRKHMIQKNVPKGAHRFDSYALPIT